MKHPQLLLQIREERVDGRNNRLVATLPALSECSYREVREFVARAYAEEHARLNEEAE